MYQHLGYMVKGQGDIPGYDGNNGYTQWVLEKSF